MGIVGALIIGAVLSAVVGGASVFANYQQNEANMEAQKVANSQNVQAQTDINNMNWSEQWKMWNATNEYNKPINQMARYAEAGLNPNLIYGQQNTTNPMSVATGQAPQVNPVLSNMDYGEMNKQFQSIIDKLTSIPSMKAQFENLTKQNDLLGQEFEINEVEVAKSSAYAKLWWNLQNDGEFFNKLYDAWSQNLIDQAKTAGIKNTLVSAQAAVQNVIKQIKEIDFTHTESKWEYELKAMEIANNIKEIDFDWAEWDKEIAAANGITKWFMLLIKTFAGR